MGGIAGIQQVALGGVAHRPVDVLARAINARKGLFVEQADKAVLFGRVAQQRHHQLLVVTGYVGSFKKGRNFKLARGHFVVAGFSRNAQAIESFLHILHEHLYSLGNGPKVVIVELLTLGRRLTKESTARQQQVGAHAGKVGID